MPPEGAIVALATRHRAAGIEIRPDTNYPAWNGESMDHALCVDALLDAS